MAFPQDPLDLIVELFYDATWNDVTQYVYTRDGVSISRGFSRSPARGVAEPQQATLTLNNRDGRFSPRNPRSPLFGKIGRNTQVRIRVTYDSVTYTRFSGEIAEWPAKWDVSGRDVWVTVTAAGPLRRLGRLSEDPQSPLRTALSDPANGLGIVGYWPMEDGGDNVGRGASFGAGIDGGRPLAIQSGRTGTSRDDSWAGSLALPTLGNAAMSVDYIAPSGAGTAFTCWFSFSIPSGGITANTRLVTVYTRGTAWVYQLSVETTGVMRMRIFDRAGTELVNSGFSTGLSENRYRLLLEAEQNGSDVDWAIAYLVEGESVGGVGSGTLAGGYTVGTVGGLEVNGDNSTGVEGCAMGHLTVMGQLNSLFATSLQFKGYDGETVSTRFDRLAASTGLTYIGFGTTNQTMGPQPAASLVDILRDLTSVEGVVTDRMTSFGLVWRGESDRLAPGLLELDYAAGDLAPPFEPIEDDDLVVNDSTVTRDGGATARFTVDTGPLSTQDPPDGVGRYSEAITLNLGRDEDALQHAAYRTAVGTYDEARVPSITVDLAARPTLIVPVMTGAGGGNAMDVFDVIEVSNLPDWMPPGVMRQSIVGYTEELGQYSWRITFQCEPQAPHDYVILNDPTSIDAARIDSDEHTLSAGVNASATSWSVAHAGNRWVTSAEDAGAFPVDLVCEGEVVTLTAVTGTTSPQTFTVTRGVANGYSAAHSSGASVRIAKPRRVAFP